MFKSASSEKKEGILRFTLQLDKLSPRVVKNTCPNSASAGLTPSAGRICYKRGPMTWAWLPRAGLQLGWPRILHQPDSFLNQTVASLCHLLAKRCNWGVWVCSAGASTRCKNTHIFEKAMALDQMSPCRPCEPLCPTEANYLDGLSFCLPS